MSRCTNRYGVRGRHRWSAIQRQPTGATMLYQTCIHCGTERKGNRIPSDQRHWFEQLERERKAGRA